MHTVFIVAVLTIAKTWRQSKVSTDKRMSEGDVYTHTHNILICKKEWDNAIFSNMDGPRDYHTKQSKSERKDKYHMVSLICEI